MRRAIALFAFVLAGCGAGTISGGDGFGPASSTAVDVLEVHPVDWNAAKADVGAIAAVVELEDSAVLFGDKGATIVAGGAVQANATGPASWTTAAVVPGADGTGPWIVGVDGDGKVLRLRARSVLEDVGARWGLGSEAVKSVIAVDDHTVVFGYAAGIAIADGDVVRRFDGPKSGIVAAGGGRIAWVEGDEVHVVASSGGEHRVFAVPGARGAAIDGDGRVVAITTREVWVERDGALALRWTSDVGDLGSVVSAPSGTWITAGTEIALLRGDTLGRSQGAALPIGARPFAATTGDLWIVGDGTARKIAATSASAEVADWTRTVQPVYARVCASCHGPGGTAGTDLSNHAAWVEHREAIEQRVIVDQTMPPKGVTLTTEDRDAIRGWLDRSRP